MHRNGRNRPANHCARRCLTPLASWLRDEDRGSRLRESEQSPPSRDRRLEQSPPGRDRRLRSRRSAGDRSLAVSIKVGGPALPLTPPPLSKRTPATESLVPIVVGRV